MKTKTAFLFCLMAGLAASAARGADGTNGVTTEGVHMHAGPGTAYPEVMRLAPTLNIAIHGCTEAREWCDVDWRGNRGWVRGGALAFAQGSALYPLVRRDIFVPLPDAVFDLASYWETHYRDRPWYAERKEWSALDRGLRLVELKTN